MIEKMIPKKVAPPPQVGPLTKPAPQQARPSTAGVQPTQKLKAKPQNGNKLKDAIESLAAVAVAYFMGKTSESSDMSDLSDVSIPFRPIKGVKKAMFGTLLGAMPVPFNSNTFIGAMAAKAKSIKTQKGTHQSTRSK